MTTQTAKKRLNVNPLNNLKVSMKLTVVFGMLVLLAIGLATGLVLLQRDAANFRSKEVVGISHIQPVYNLIHDLQLHRGRSTQFLNGNREVTSELNQVALRINEEFSDFQKFLTENGDPLGVRNEFLDYKSDWESLLPVNRSLEWHDSFDRHTHIIHELSILIEHISDASNLTLDPDLDTFYMMDIVSFTGHVILDQLAQIRGLGLTMIEANDFPFSDMNHMNRLAAAIRMEHLEASFKNIYKENPEFADKVKTTADRTIEQLKVLTHDVDKFMIAGRIDHTNEEFFIETTEPIDALFSLIEITIPFLTNELESRADALHTRNLWIEVISISLIGVALYLAIVVGRGISQAISTTVNTLENISNAKYDNTIEVTSKDEFGQLISSLGTMQTQLRERITADKKLADENARIKQALDVADTPVMLADSDFNIIYMNKSVDKMMTNLESDIRKTLNQFDAKSLVGSNVDQFHKNPSHQRQLLDSITSTHESTIKISGLTLQVLTTPLFNDEGERLGTVVEWADLTQELATREKERQIANENTRIRQALDNVSTNAMVADADRNIVYMNNAVKEMMLNAESDLRKDLPNFDAKNLMGASMDDFHKNPSHQKNLLDRLTKTYVAQVEVGGRTFKLAANPVYDEQNERIGSVVEWTDRTEEVAVEKEIDNLVQSAASGDLTKRIDTANKKDFFLNLGEGLNRFVDIAEAAISDTARVLDAMAHGNLTESIEKEYQGSFGKLKKDANTTVEKLTEIIGQIRESARTVSTGADEIAQGNADLSQRTEEQASSLEETASSMEEMTSTVKQSAENAMQVNDLSMEAKNKAQVGGRVVENAVQAMDEINVASKKIADIIGVINDIAFQTNLLALNAAVEAARAGEQGRGFAVVAAEVRSLAQRSAGAAKEIKNLIEDSVEKVEAGTNLVNESGQTLQEIVGSVEQVSEMVNDISNAAQEQTVGIEQVSKAVTQMDEMTQQNAALVEEASAAGEAMAEQSRTMLNLMNFFTTKLDGQESSVSYMANAAGSGINQSSSHTEPVKAASHKVTGPTLDDPEDEWEEF